MVALIATSLLVPQRAVAQTPPEPEVRFGAALGPRPGETRPEILADIEAEVGQDVRAIRAYTRWEASNFPTPLEAEEAAAGTTIVLSVIAKNADGSALPWREIADAEPGDARHDEIVAWADRVKAFGHPITFTFNHEPETEANVVRGTDADFVDAWRRVVDVFRAEGVTNATYLWIATDYAFSVPTSDRRHVDRWYPGDAWVDAIGMDVYNWYDCRRTTPIPWKSPTVLLADFMAFADAHPGKALWLPEFGSAEDPADPDRKAAWVTELFDLLASPGYERFDGVLVFHSQPQQANSDCEWWVDSSEPTRAAFADALADPFFGGRPPVDPPDDDAVVTLVVADPATLEAGEAALRDRLAARDLVVQVLADTAASSTAVEGSGAVVVTTSARPWRLPSSLDATPVSLLAYKPWAYDELRLSNGNGAARWAQDLDVAAPGHPLAAGLTGTVRLYDGGGGNVPVVTPAGGTVVATRPGGDPVVVAWEQGEALATGAADGCRATIAAYRGTAARLSVDGLAMFDAAVDWAIACSPGTTRLPTAALVVQRDDALNAGEQELRSLLRASGYAVTVVDDGGLVVASLEPHAVAVVSNNVSTSSTRVALNATTTPVVLHKPYLADDLHLSSANGPVVNTATFEVQLDTHDAAAGLSGTEALYDDGPGAAPVLGAGTTTGDVVATIGGAPAVVTMTAGQQGPDGIAVEGCRVFAPFWNNDVRRLSTAGRTLFTNVVAWADACQP